MDLKDTINSLDLENHINVLKSFFAIEKNIQIDGDIKYNYELINSIDKSLIKKPENIEPLKRPLDILKKQGILSISEISNFIKIIRYFSYLLSSKLDDKIDKWVKKVEIPQSLIELNSAYDKSYELRYDYNDKLLDINSQISQIKTQISRGLENIISKNNSSEYLIDNNVHFRKNTECLLARSGYSHFIKANILDRSKNGFLYIVPKSIQSFKLSLDELNSQKENLLIIISREFSLELTKNILFLRFIYKQFNFFDSLLGRVLFAKSSNYSILLPEGKSLIRITNFHHPAVRNSKSINVDFDKNILLITGVNAGGKTVLLKSILSIALCAKFLIPMNIDKNSKIPKYKNITAIISDMQDINAGISTFASRMEKISKTFNNENSLIGIDECELGTDSEEASALFKAIFDELEAKNHKIIITTHHKKLASLMVKDNDCELLSAIYDEVKQKPTFEFLSGGIGKSFAFETAIRYNIPKTIIDKARQIYGKDGDKLNNLIEQSISLEQSLKLKQKKLDEEYEEINQIKKDLEEKHKKWESDYKAKRNNLINTYQESIQEVKKTAKKPKPKIDTVINKIYKKTQNLEYKTNKEILSFKVGDIVKYKNIRGKIRQINKKYAFIDSDEMRIKALLAEIEPSFQNKKERVVFKVQKPNSGNIKLDLHGQRVEEAIENTDKFISDAYLHNFTQVVIYHGIGSGKLAFAIKQYLNNSPFIKATEDARQSEGGFGATNVFLFSSRD